MQPCSWEQGPLRQKQRYSTHSYRESLVCEHRLGMSPPARRSMQMSLLTRSFSKQGYKLRRKIGKGVWEIWQEKKWVKYSSLEEQTRVCSRGMRQDQGPTWGWPSWMWSQTRQHVISSPTTVNCLGTGVR